ncbi:putative hydrolase of the HAD superfamily [Alkalibacillus filiformis]|uniref:Hydrolase of the HAD superfamily n=1 Tax=Alkalibacillus filiformis TaxID=200990 RepID=A0ABU0DPG6_9BACI|nr:HAD family hydrolase [Alkalibacillus filiformis]MDQ0350348.1 putative hydrolase of the HAD superfamily [Alkalibacillus filiformis]
MKSYKAILFDLDDTLLNRDQAVDQMFSIIYEECYENVPPLVENKMLQRFKEHDLKGYGNGDKEQVLKPFFDEFPRKFPLQNNNDIQVFWDYHFPRCFSINQNTIDTINNIKKQVKVGIITNGSTQRQKAKINNTNLNQWFETIIISEGVGFSKPDKRIFELALNKLNVQPEDTLFVGDHIEKDISGCQNAGINGVWLNPHKVENNTEIKPYAEVDSFDRLLSYIQ